MLKSRLASGLCVLSLATAPTLASAESSAVHLDGFAQISLEALNYNTSGIPMGHAYLELSVDPSVLPDNFGFAVWTNNWITESSVSSANGIELSYTTDFGTFTVGSPRAANFEKSQMPQFAGSYFFDDVLFYRSGELWGFLSKLFNSNGMGARYDGQFGPLSLSVSGHDLLNLGTVNYVTGAVRYDFDRGYVLATVDKFNTPIGYCHIEAGMDFEVVSVGAGLTKACAVDPYYAAVAWVRYQASSALSLNGMVSTYDSGFWDVTGEARYQFANGSYLNVAAMQSNAIEPMYTIAFGHEF